MPRRPTPGTSRYLRGIDRTGPIGAILPGDDLEVAREIARLDAELKRVRKLINTAATLPEVPEEEPPHLEVFWQGAVAPTATGAFGGVWRVPYVDGASVTFALERALFRFETVPTVAYDLRIEKSVGGGAFVATTVATGTIAIGAHEDSDTTSLGTVDSGQLLRVYCAALGAGAAYYSIQLEGTQA